EISERGLVNLAQMLGGKKLIYSGDVQPFLRDLMTLPKTQPQPAATVPATTLPPDNNFIEGDLPKEKATPDTNGARPKDEMDEKVPIPEASVPQDASPVTPPHEGQATQPPTEPPAVPPAPSPTEAPTKPPPQEIIEGNPPPEQAAPAVGAPRLEAGTKEESQTPPPTAVMPPEGQESDIPAPLPEPPAPPPTKLPTEPPEQPLAKPPVESPARPGVENDTPPNSQSGWWPRSRHVLLGLVDSLCPAAVAAAVPEPWRGDNVLAWKTPPDDAAAYLKKMLAILDATAKKQSDFNSLANPSDFLAAVAWQESCFRQFIPKNGRMTFVLSSNNTSVGLMQVNERVWRGLYDQERLRWDMPYNAAAGAEITALYLRQVQKKKGRLPAGNDMVEAAVYAMYNGGPGQLDQFIRRAGHGNLNKIDRLFLEKLGWSKAHAWSKAVSCLGNG
ncbi:MAG: transglycosylase SLT domain-containing protein, partial [Desulfobulbaceae bacterium]|nr:transglycosylase SLT domain-containing protein [Desulfobulbaceae bacterium]